MLRPWSCISMVLWSRISGMHVETNDTVALSLVRYSITPHMKMQTRVPFLYTPPPPTPSTHTIHIKCFTGTQGHTQMGIPFEYTPFVNWKMGVYQNVTPTNVVAYLFEQHKSLLFSDQLNLSALDVHSVLGNWHVQIYLRLRTRLCFSFEPGKSICRKTFNKSSDRQSHWSTYRSTKYKLNESEIYYCFTCVSRQNVWNYCD